MGTQRKVTVSLSRELVGEVERLVDAGEAPSKSAFYEAALRQRVHEIRRRQRRLEMEQASRDPLFLADIEEVERDFQHADAETARMIQ